ncbi:MAG: metalloregulator ArsR/SmtB family transcription factor [Chloroflexota bacterium]
MLTYEDLDRTFAALADPTRRAIVERLMRGDATVAELSAPFSISQPSISNHLRVLEHAGLISRGRVGQTRPCRLEPAPLRHLAMWIDTYRQEWEGRLDRLGRFLQESAKPSEPSAVDSFTGLSTVGEAPEYIDPHGAHDA